MQASDPDSYTRMGSVFSPWGHYSIRLGLPSTIISIDGLSERQHESIRRDYAAFVRACPPSANDSGIVCQAGRMPQPLDIEAERLTSHGQYTPIRVRDHHAIDITGNNFRARIGLDGRSPLSTSLCVAREEELPQANVLENFLRILLAHQVLGYGGALLHSVGLVVDGRAFLFAGRSNAGKTTLARKADGSGVRVLSDDINLVLPRGEDYLAHAVPFTGEFGRRGDAKPGSVPLAGILLLEKGPQLRGSPVTPSRAVATLLAGCPFVNSDEAEFSLLLDALTSLVDHTPVARLAVARGDGFEAIMSTAKEILDND